MHELPFAFSARGSGARFGALAALAAAVLPSLPAIARADCSQPPFELIWAYPEDGAQDVPTNAVFWLLVSTWSAPSVATLNGGELEVVPVTFGGSKIEPGPLEPDTDYVLRLEHGEQTEEDAGEANGVRISFRTGRGRATRLGPPDVSGSRTSEQRPAGMCDRVIAAQDCFDTGQDTLLSFEVEDENAIAWLVLDENYSGSSTVWPAGCGDPALFVYGGFRIGCKDVSAIGPGGLIGEASSYCPPAPAAMGGTNGARDVGARPASDAGGLPGTRTSVDQSDDSDGCSASGSTQPGRGWPWIAALALLRSRRRARPLATGL